MPKELEDKENKLKREKVNQVKNEDVKKKNTTATKGKSANSKSNKNNSVVKSKENSSNVKLEKKDELKKTKTSLSSKSSISAKGKKAIDTNKKETSSKTAKRTTGKTSSKKTQTSEKSKLKTENKAEEKENKKEATIIDKIKSFLAKIAEMQEEAKKERAEKKELLAKEKEEKETKNKKEENPKANYMLEYYDLPYRYNETVVKILAQTPKRLFVYWDIADSDRQKYINAFGEDFFEKTYPVLLVYNENKNYVTEVTINDFANSWYIDINDPKTNYVIQLGRKFRDRPAHITMEKLEEEKIILHTDYLPIADSNKLEAPNDHILFEEMKPFVTFRNVKNNQEVVKEFSELKNEFGKTYDIKEFYNEMYKEEIDEGIFDMNNPSSGLNSSSFK